MAQWFKKKKNPPTTAGDPGSIPGLGRSPGEGNGNPLQYACLENPMDKGAWQSTVRGVERVGHYLVTKSPPQFFKCLIEFTSEAFPCSEGNLGLIPGLERSPGEGNGNPLQYSCLEKSHGHGSMVGYGPWGCKSRTCL